MFSARSWRGFRAALVPLEFSCTVAVHRWFTVVVIHGEKRNQWVVRSCCIFIFFFFVAMYAGLRVADAST